MTFWLQLVFTSLEILNERKAPISFSRRSMNWDKSLPKVHLWDKKKVYIYSEFIIHWEKLSTTTIMFLLTRYNWLIFEGCLISTFLSRETTSSFALNSHPLKQTFLIQLCSIRAEHRYKQLNLNDRNGMCLCKCHKVCNQQLLL